MVPCNNNKGFTLTELAILCVLIGVVGAIAIPNIISWLPEMRLKRGAMALHSHMVNVRMNAVKENRDWAIVFDTANNRYFVCDDAGADGNWVGAGDPTGAGDNNIVGTYCMDGSAFDIPGVNPDPACSQRESGIVLGSGDAANFDGGAIVADKVSYNNNFVAFNSQGIGNSGYVYMEHDGATSSFAVGTLTSGVVRVLKSARGANDYEL